MKTENKIKCYGLLSIVANVMAVAFIVLSIMGHRAFLAPGLLMVIVANVLFFLAHREQNKLKQNKKNEEQRNG